MSTTTKKIEDGGPAFPAEGGYASGLHPAPGMSLRDYFAAKVLQGFAADPNLTEGTPEEFATMAYRWADAMLAERAKGIPVPACEICGKALVLGRGDRGEDLCPDAECQKKREVPF